ncbi:MAG: DNA-binding protein, partial [Prevotella sp.]|nr:DNA-binding protein [Prevotella sp.]
SVSITCYDRNGNLVKRVTSTDDADIEDPENDPSTGSGQAPDGGNTPSGSGGGSESGGGSGGNEDGGGSLI